MDTHPFDRICETRPKARSVLPWRSDPGEFSGTRVLASWLTAMGAGAVAAQGNRDETDQAAALFQSLVDLMPLNLLIKDATGRRVFANRRYLELQGCRAGRHRRQDRFRSVSR